MTKKIKKTILIFGSLSVVLLSLFQLQQWSLFALGSSKNLYLVITGIMFLLLGIVVSRYIHLKTEVRKRELIESDLTDQELQVLQLIADGHSNKEIGRHLYIAETTVKSHVSNIFMKLNAKRRTEAVKIGRDLQII